MFDPINKIFRRYNGNQIRADHIKMLCKDKNVINDKRGCEGFSFWQMEKKALYLSVNVLSTKVLIEDTIFTSPNGDGTAILRGHPSHAKVQPPAGQRKYLHFSVILRP